MNYLSLSWGVNLTSQLILGKRRKKIFRGFINKRVNLAKKFCIVI